MIKLLTKLMMMLMMMLTLYVIEGDNGMIMLINKDVNNNDDGMPIMVSSISCLQS